MQKSKHLLILFLFLTVSFRIHAEPKKTQAHMWVEYSRDVALYTLKQAMRNTRESTKKNTLASMYMGLLTAVLIWPEGRDFSSCKGQLAINYSFAPEEIIICKKILKYDRYNAKILAQILIHESAHVVGVHKECAATRLEVAAVRSSDLGLVFKSRYFKRCGIH